MNLNNINYLIELQDVLVSIFEKDTENSTLLLTVEVPNPVQACPCCGKRQDIILKGVRSLPRMVRHLDCFTYRTYLLLPSIRLYCTKCDCSFTYTYEFVGERERYTHAFQKQVFDALEGTTIKYVSEKYDLPYTTCERIIKQKLADAIPVLQESVVSQAEETEFLVIGIDDFANRKGHTYNTGFHDLRNGSLLAVTFGRTYSQLTQRKNLKAILARLNPIAVVMDLAKSYHKFTAEYFPNAIRIADRFHVNRYVTEALQKVRIRISKTLTPESKRFLKRNKNILGRRYDNLSKEETQLLIKLLSFSEELSDVYYMKEQLISWYDLTNKKHAHRSLLEWIQSGRELQIPELDDALKTFENWSTEISNYHKCRYTNAAVEGRNNKIKTLQRRCFFLRNRQIYKNRIYHECNKAFW